MAKRVLSHDVKAIVYRHAKTGELMVHAFGPHGEDIELKAWRRRLVIDNIALDDATRTAAVAKDDGTVVLLNEDGQSIWADL